jgi:hypothetical protein
MSLALQKKKKKSFKNYYFPEPEGERRRRLVPCARGDTTRNSAPRAAEGRQDWGL